MNQVGTSARSAARDRLRELVRAHAIVHGDFVLSSGAQASWYADLRRVTLDGRSAPLVGEVMLELTRDWQYEAVGGLTLGADPVALAMVHAAAARDRELTAFIVRKEAKQHGLQRRVEGPSISGKQVLVVEDTSTTGRSLLEAVDAAREEGAEVVGAAALIARGAAPTMERAGLRFRTAFTLPELGLA
jgi:orotate phosphoribosyltransferase